MGLTYVAPCNRRRPSRHLAPKKQVAIHVSASAQWPTGRISAERSIVLCNAPYQHACIRPLLARSIPNSDAAEASGSYRGIDRMSVRIEGLMQHSCGDLDALNLYATDNSFTEMIYGIPRRRFAMRLSLGRCRQFISFDNGTPIRSTMAIQYPGLESRQMETVPSTLRHATSRI
jgi:hypothetical protein